jgi:hypothetical protein
MGVHVEVKPLKWGEQSDMSQFGSIDTIIGSELAYDATNINYLISTFQYFIKYTHGYAASILI